MKRLLLWLLIVSLLVSLFPAAVSAEETSVYIRKHVSILYDNSGSMKANVGNLRWCYASYAAQMFTGLLNDTDFLDITFMEGDPLSEIDLVGSRQKVVDAILSKTNVATASTPLKRIDTALDVLTGDGLVKGQGANSPGEQYWLVLTTDGQFLDEHEQEVSDETVVNKIAGIMTEYPDLHLVYFGIGSSSGEANSSNARDFRETSTGVEGSLLKTLHAHKNFTALYAENDDQIVDTMRSLSNQISGRYTVNNHAEINGNEVRLHLSAEASPIRNIAIMAQKTNAKLLSVTDEQGNALSVSRDAQIRYPHNSAYSNIEPGTLGGYVALITDPNGKKLPNGTVTLTFSEPVVEDDLVLMYEPAIFLRLQVERDPGSDEWESLDENDKLLEGDRIRVSYDICEDGTGEVLDPNKLFGETFFDTLLNGTEFDPNEPITVTNGDLTIEIRASMMDGAYNISTTKVFHVSQPGLEDFTIRSSGPIELQREKVGENTDKYVEFTALFRDQPAPEDFTDKLDIRIEGETGSLKGNTERPSSNILRFTPKDETCKAGTYSAKLFYEGTELAAETITILPKETTYSAVASESISIKSNAVANNTDSVSFTVTAHTDTGDRPIEATELDLFTVKAGVSLDGLTDYRDGGVISFTLQDASATAGIYPVTLYFKDTKLAETSIVVLRHDAKYSVESIVSNPPEVDRFELCDNTSTVSFIVYEDDIPCTAEQLQAMLGNQIELTHNLDSCYAEMNIEIGTANGKPAIVCTPTSSTQNGFLLFFHRMLIAAGIRIGATSLSADSINFDLKVNMVNSAGGSAKLSILGEGWIYLIILLAIVAVLTLIFLFFFANAKYRRLHKGTILSFTISRTESTPYTVSSVSSKKTGDGWIFLFTRWCESVKIGSISFKAEAQRTSRRQRLAKPKIPKPLFSWRRQHPSISVPTDVAHEYASASVNADAKVLISKIKGGETPRLDIKSSKGVIGQYFSQYRPLGTEPKSGAHRTSILGSAPTQTSSTAVKPDDSDKFNEHRRSFQAQSACFIIHSQKTDSGVKYRVHYYEAAPRKSKKPSYRSSMPKPPKQKSAPKRPKVPRPPKS